MSALAMQASGGTSNTQTVSIAAAAPTLTSSLPTTLNANSQTQSLVLSGTNFIAPVKVHFGGSLIDVTPTSATQLTVPIAGALLRQSARACRPGCGGW